VATVLEELNQRKQNVGDEPCQEERQQDAAQSVEQHNDAHYDDDSHQATDKTVESNLLLLHNSCKINKKKNNMTQKEQEKRSLDENLDNYVS
jgi:hypothetical protein